MRKVSVYTGNMMPWSSQRNDHILFPCVGTKLFKSEFFLLNLRIVQMIVNLTRCTRSSNLDPYYARYTRISYWLIAQTRYRTVNFVQRVILFQPKTNLVFNKPQVLRSVLTGFKKKKKNSNNLRTCGRIKH